MYREVVPFSQRIGVKMKQGTRAATVLAAVVLSVGASFATAQAPASEPFIKRHIYSETSDPRADIAAAFKQARREHKRVLLDFGGDWCGDCHILDMNFHDAQNQPLLDKHFVLVHVFVGHLDRNADIAARYEVPIEHGVPALAVLDASGKVLFSQRTGNFRQMHTMDSAAVNEFLNHWKG